MRKCTCHFTLLNKSMLYFNLLVEYCCSNWAISSSTCFSLSWWYWILCFPSGPNRSRSCSWRISDWSSSFWRSASLSKENWKAMIRFYDGCNVKNTRLYAVHVRNLLCQSFVLYWICLVIWLISFVIDMYNI